MAEDLREEHMNHHFSLSLPRGRLLPTKFVPDTSAGDQNVDSAPCQPQHLKRRAALAAYSICLCRLCLPSSACQFWQAPNGLLPLFWLVLLPFHMRESVRHFSLIPLSSLWSCHGGGYWGGGLSSSKLYSCFLISTKDAPHPDWCTAFPDWFC